MSVAIVTDSTAYLGEDVEGAEEVRVVPLQVVMGNRTGTDGVDVTSAEVVEALLARQSVTTSRPSPGQFSQVYQELLDGGADHVVSIHISSRLSGTWESAVLASQDFGHGVVRVVDSRSTGGALGFAVRAALLKARSGADAAKVQEAAVHAVDTTRTYFYVDKLEYLRRGGRIGMASAMVGTSLAVKPILQVIDGQIAPLEKVRTSSKALARLAQLAVDASVGHRVDLAVHHMAAAERAEALGEQLRAEIPTLRRLNVTEISTVVGAHMGPGAVGIAVLRLDPSDD